MQSKIWQCNLKKENLKMKIYEKISMCIEKSLYERVMDYRFAQKFNNKTEAILKLIEIGLANSDQH